MGAHGSGGSSGGFSSGGSAFSSGGSAFSSAGSSGTFNAFRSSSAFSSSSFTTFNALSTRGERRPKRDHYDDPPILLPWSSRDARNGLAVSLVVAFLAALSTGSLWMMFGVYGSKQMEIGLNYSHILQANKLLVESISVRNLDQVPGVRLYLFENQPLLNNTKEWIAEHNVVVLGNHHQEWAFWLNRGSKVNMVYDLPLTSSLFIIVARGIDNFNDWVRDPYSSDSCVLWRFVHDHGQISFEAGSDGDYYFGLGNLDEKSVEMTFRMEITSKTYETETANSWCPLDVKVCKVLPSLRGSKIGLLTTPDKPQEGLDVWQVKISYRTRWQTYLIFGGALLFATFLIWSFVCKPKNISDSSLEETPLNSEQDAFAYSREANINSNSVLHNKPKISSKVKTIVEETGEENVCVICFEDNKDSFFQPCGHCATCYGCGLRIKESSSLCPICRKPIQDIRKIFKV